MAIDTTNCPIQKPTNPQLAKDCYEHRYHMEALKYETGISYKTERQCWLSGPYPGSMHDLTIARTSGVLHGLQANEFVLADKAYVSREPHLIAPFRPCRTVPQYNINLEIKRRRQIIERFHKRLKQWEFTTKPWRHSFKMHALCMKVVCDIINIDMRRHPLNKQKS